MIVGARIGIPALVGGLVGWRRRRTSCRSAGSPPSDPFRKIGFLIALGMILGAAILDVCIDAVAGRGSGSARRASAGRSPIRRKLEARQHAARWSPGSPSGAWRWWRPGRATAARRLATSLFALALVFVFVLVNGISLGITDSNPISRAFVVTVFLLAALGLREPAVGMIVATILLVSTSVGCDMQQDRSTGWRLGTNRIIQFRYQVIGVLMGAILAVVLAKLFMAAYPVLRLDQTTLPADQQPAEWAAAMTYKFVGALRGLVDDKPYQRTAIWLGIGIGLTVAVLRKLLKESARYRRFVAGGRAGFATDFLVDSVLLPSPYASSFGGFVNLPTSAWFAAGGVAASAINTFVQRREHKRPGDDVVPEDMNATSLVGGGLIAGDALAALGLGVAGLVRTVA